MLALKRAVENTEMFTFILILIQYWCIYRQFYPIIYILGLNGRHNIGNIGKTASMSMLTLFESTYTLKGRYNIGNIGHTASMSTVCLLSLNQDIHYREHRQCWQNCFYECANSLWIKIYFKQPISERFSSN